MSGERQRHSPYLILGVDFGATAVEANKAFARRVAALAEGDLPFGQEELNWAQTQFRQHGELRRSLRYLRAPIGAARPPEVQEGTLFRPAPEPMARRTEPLPADDRAALVQSAYVELYVQGLRELRPVAYNPYGHMEEGSADGRP